MTELERMRKYIENTRLPNLHNYQMGLHDMLALGEVEETFDRTVMAFEYGLAKGWRAARAEVRRGKVR